MFESASCLSELFESASIAMMNARLGLQVELELEPQLEPGDTPLHVGAPVHAPSEQLYVPTSE
jgi:hypothetical protein